ncbi:MAG: histidine phosphatase family protein [Clostridia bacterium]|nr:histidine phosphatase family protein [Clostridia bacterium]
MLLFYIRHGDPIYDPDSLTPLGERQAEAVAKRLALFGMDEIYASTSNRAQLTAKPTAELLKKEVQLLDFCNESHVWDEFAIDDGNGYGWIFHKPKFRRMLACAEVTMLCDRWYEYPEFQRYKFKEGVQRVNRELDGFIAGLGYEHDREQRVYRVVSHNDKRVALFAHQGFGISFLSSVLDIPYPIVADHFDMCHSGMTVIAFYNEDGIAIPKALTISNDSHIYREGLPMNYNNGGTGF